ncbi:MAG: FAD-binding protein [Rhodobacteraceae bacterium]|nr:FAD-binding protein [Paracoccaceae bacterium]
MPILKPPASFSATVPVLIAGAGACGMTAALAARDAGADVLILEKDSLPQGTTSMSQGTMCAAGTRAQKAAGIDDHPDIFFNDVMTKVNGKTDPEFVRTVTREAAPTVDWLDADHGIPFAVDTSWRGLGHSVQRLHAPPEKNGQELIGYLSQAVERAGADLLTNAHVTDVYADDDGRVLGVRVTRPDGSFEDIGCNALVLATCGYAADPEMIRTYIPDMAGVRTFTWENSRGDAVKWGLALGAAVADMSAFQGYGALADPQMLLFNYNYVIDGGIMVTSEGRRFSNEVADVSGQGVNVMRQPGGIAFMIYDQTLHERHKHLYETRQALAVNAVKFADTADGLARALGIDAAALNATLKQLEDIKAGTQRDPLGRDFTGTHPLAPPYAGIRVTGALYHTQGGLVVDHNAQVKRTDGGVLPNLFAGGGAARGMSGPTCSGYIPAAGLCMAMTLGRLAGRGAATLARK